MKLKHLIWTFLLVTVVYAQEKQKEVTYIQKYAKMAVQEMNIYGIPASITLAQGILESTSGTSELAENANNHFGIKCKGKEWSGKTYDKVSPEHVGGRTIQKRSCFRFYTSIEEGFRDHSKFIAERPYYTSCFKLKSTDYKGFAKCLKTSGYATDRNYASKLINRIEAFDLHQFDYLKVDDVDSKLVSMFGPQEDIVDLDDLNDLDQVAENQPQQVKPQEETGEEQETMVMEIPTREESPRSRIKRHPIKRDYVVVKEGETLNELSRLYKVSVKKLMAYNEINDPKKLLAGQNLFFGKKRNKGAQKTYKTKQGETMYFIAQKTGIKLKKLYKRNRMKPSEEPAAGQIMYLKGKRPKK